MKEFLVNIYPWTSRFRALAPQLIKDIKDTTTSIVSAQEGGKKGSPTVWKEERVEDIPICKTLQDNLPSHY